MSIVSITVTVPVSGDGPIVDISALVGPKTVQLTGTFEGYYDLLVSHNGVNFTAAVAFDASGPEGLKQTIPGAFNYVRLHANAQSPSGVTCSVTGVSAVGENGFGTIATLAAGFSGLTPIIDTSAFITPTGSEADTNFICQGDFHGPIVVLGSADGVLFNPIGEFRVDRRPEGAPAIVALTPLVTEAKVRYVRLQVTAVLQGAVVVTMGGRVPATGGGVSGTPMDVYVVTLGGQVFKGLGDILLGSTLSVGTVVIGPGHTIDATGNSSLAVIGAQNILAANSFRSNVFGHNNLVQGQGSNSTVVGNANSVGNTAGGPLFVGGDNNSMVCQYGAVVGNDNSVGFGNNRIYVLGSFNTLNNFTGGSAVVGHTNQVLDQAANSMVFGSDNIIDQVANGPTLVAGKNNTMGSQRGVIVGHSCSTTLGLSTNFIIGYDNHITGGSTSHNILLGDTITTAGGDDNLLFGRNITALASVQSNVVMGSSLNLNASAFGNVVICPVGATTDLANSTNTITIGNGHVVGNSLDRVFSIGSANSVADTLVECVLVGSNLTATSATMIEIGGSLTVGSNTGSSIILGYNTSLGDNSTSCVLIHNGAIGVNSSQSISIRGTIGDNCETSIAMGGGSVGAAAGVGAVNNIAIGSATIADQSTNSIILGGVNGGSSSVGSNATEVCIVGKDCNVGGFGRYIQVMGSSITTTNDFGANFTRQVIVGTSMSVTNTNLGADRTSNIVAIGDSVTLRANVEGTGPTSTISMADVVAIGSALNVVATASVDSYSRLILIGSDLSSGLSDGTGKGTLNNILIGSQSTANDLCEFNILIGNAITLQPSGVRNVVIAPFGGTTIEGNRNVGIGVSPRIGSADDDVICIGSNVDPSTVSVADGCSGAVCLNGTIQSGSSASIAIGYLATVASAAEAVGIAIGEFSSATSQQCVIGCVDDANHGGSINDFIVQGTLQPGDVAIYTLRALASPAAGECGLVVTYNSAGTITNKTLKAAVSPPVGSLLTYVDP